MLPTNLLPLLPQMNIMSEGSTKILENIYHTVHHHIPKECLIHCLEQLRSLEIRSHYRYMLQHGFSDTFISRYLGHYLILGFHSISLVIFHCFTVHFDSLSFIHTNSSTFSYNYVSVF